jgi:N4-gp56 family major capsid protein
MATQLNSTVNVNSGTGALATKPQAFYDKLLLKLLVQSDFIHSKLAQQRPMPKRSGDTINFRKITKLTPSLTPLTEGVTPDGQNASVTAISATTAPYGEWMHFTDLIDVTQLDDIVKEYTVELARMMREKIDLLVRDVLNKGTNVSYAAGRTSRDTLVTGDIPTIADLRKSVLSFKRNLVKPAMGGKYIAIVTPSVVHDLLDDASFLKAYEIGQNNKPFIEGEIADVYGIKFIEAVNGYTVGNGNATTPATVHSTVLLGAGAYGITKINGEGDAKMIVKPLGSSGTEDPLNQRQSIGSKVNAFTAKRLEEQAIIRYESVPTNQ